MKIKLHQSGKIVWEKYDKHTHQGVMVYVQPPMRRLVGFTDYDASKHKEVSVTVISRYLLSFPYVLFRVNYRRRSDGFYYFGLQVAFAIEPEPTQIYLPPLPNIGEGLYVCIGDLGRYGWAKCRKRELCQSVVDAFWTNLFSYEMTWAVSKYGRRPLQNIDRWEKLTKQNPLWIPEAKNLVKYDMEYLEFCER